MKENEKMVFLKGMKFFSLSNGDKHIGECKNGLAEGYGVRYYSNGNIYRGQYRNEKKEGYGIFIFSDSDIYEGEWKMVKKWIWNNL